MGCAYANPYTTHTADSNSKCITQFTYRYITKLWLSAYRYFTQQLEMDYGISVIHLYNILDRKNHLMDQNLICIQLNKEKVNEIQMLLAPQWKRNQ